MNLRHLMGWLCFLFILLSCSSKDPKVNSKKVLRLCQSLVKEKASLGISIYADFADTILLSESYGWADLDKTKEIERISLFRIASITKPITATAVLQLVESGRLSLYDKVIQFFPDYPNGNKITIYHLLSHTSGIPNWWEGDMPDNIPDNFPMCKTPHLFLQQMKNGSLFEPGTQWSYSNSGYILLGEIIEMISHMKYEKYLEQNIFEIAKMNHTELEYIDEPQDKWVSGSVQDQNNTFSHPVIYHMPFSAGGLRSTSEDLILFFNALENGKLVSKEMFDQMTTYAKLENGKEVYESLYSPNHEPPSFPNNIKKFGYGLGFQIVENYGEKVISHGGDIAGFNSIFMYVPKNGVKMAILSNTENGLTSKLRDIEKLLISIE